MGFPTGSGSVQSGHPLAQRALPAFFVRPSRLSPPALPAILTLAALTLTLTGTASAEGDIQLRLYSVPPPLSLLDSVSVSVHYQTPAGGPSNATVDVSAERSLLTFGVRYSRPHHTFQTTGRRSADLAAGRTDMSGTLVYTYAPQVPAQGVALTSITTLYALSGNQSPTSGYRTHTVVTGGSLRLNRELNISAAATATATELPAQDKVVWSGGVNGSLTYARSGSNAYLAPSVNIQNGAARWNVSGGGSAKVSPALTASATASLAQGSPGNASGTLAYSAGRWQLRGAAATNGTHFSVSAGARLTFTERLSAGATVSYTPATRTPTYAADISTQAGGLRFGVNASLTTPPATEPTVTAQASISGQGRPWQGGLNLSYTHAPTGTTGSATGTLNYASAPFGAQLGLGLNLSRPAIPSATTSAALTGRADLTVNYAVTPELDVSGSARYERSVAQAAAATYRYGVGLRYRFGIKESP